MNIIVDFDGCIAENDYPELGTILPNAKEVINYWHSRSHTIIVNTCTALHFAENAKNYLINCGINLISLMRIIQN